jgi:hypothetical protein
VQVSSTRYASFLVRMWCGRGQESAPPTEVWQGEVEHIQTSQRWTFQALEELVRLLRQQVEEADATEGE